MAQSDIITKSSSTIKSADYSYWTIRTPHADCCSNVIYRYLWELSVVCLLSDPHTTSPYSSYAYLLGTMTTAETIHIEIIINVTQDARCLEACLSWSIFITHPYQLGFNRMTTRRIWLSTSNYVVITPHSLTSQSLQLKAPLDDADGNKSSATSSTIDVKYRYPTYQLVLYFFPLANDKKYLHETHLSGSTLWDPHRSYPDIPLHRHTRMLCECKSRLHIGIVCPCNRCWHSCSP